MKFVFGRSKKSEIKHSDVNSGECDLTTEVENEIRTGTTSLNKITESDSLLISESLKAPSVRYEPENNKYLTGVLSPEQEIISKNLQRINFLRESAATLASSLHYVPFDIYNFKTADTTLKQNVLHLFVCLASDLIISPNHTIRKEVTEWSYKTLQSISKILNINNIASEAILRPISMRVQALNNEEDDNFIVMDKVPIIIILKEAFESMNDKVFETFNETYTSLNPDESDSMSDSSIDQLVIDTENMKIEEPEDTEKILERCITALSVQSNENSPNNTLINTTINNLRQEDSKVDIKTVINFKSDKKISPPPAILVFLRNFITAYIMAGNNDARSHILIQKFGAEFGISDYSIYAIQDYLSEDLVSTLDTVATESIAKKRLRQAKIAAAAIGSGALIAFTAGVAAPALAAGVAAIGIGGGGLSAFLGSTTGLAFVASVFGASGAGLTGWKCSKRFATIKTFEFKMLHNATPRCLSLAICISGQISDESEITSPWEKSFESPFCDVYALRWEPELLMSLSGMVTKMVSQTFAVNAAKFWLSRTAASALAWPIMLIDFASSLDNAWSLCRLRARQAGIILATAIADKTAIGNRPVSLIGYSMGSRVIYYALLRLYEMRVFNSVKDVIFMGLPSTAGTTEWQMCRNVVSGRLINVFSSNDWVLGFLYRCMEWQISVAGLKPIEVEGVENWDASNIILNHSEWAPKMATVMASLGYDL